MDDPNSSERDQMDSDLPSDAKQTLDQEPFADDRRVVYLVIGLIFLAFLIGFIIMVFAASLDWIK